MNPYVVDRLRCPVCAEPLAEAVAGTARTLRCPRRHSFDVARQGYVNLLAGRAPHVGDTAEMVAARSDFLAAGHYAAISTALTDAARTATLAATEPTDSTRTGAARTEAVRTGAARTEAVPPDRTDEPGRAAYPLVVDAGGGTGWHLAAVLAALPGAVGLTLDVSKPALRRAARAHPRAAAALVDTWQRLPLADGCVAVLLNVFAPRNGAEFRRVLATDGRLLVVTPAEDHLTELVDALGLLRVDPAKADRVAGSLAGHFTEVAATVLRGRLSLTHAEVGTLVGMGPSAWHTDPGALAERIATRPEPVTVTLAVRLGVHRPR
ncbi:putative RNA methyltransferase [Micromonospora yangpuensis]|uniref:23S rRNA m(1)G-748 methyltransferase n=1 Tax=Micromonospora yangpuensis TaxID=683228 RepID=A0A1C6U5K7_9ACTN|nr:23S rRNA methyltransferase [Micromonospora yangpuensis]GGL91518.1 rRNA (guanine-N1)-methyltransferase [Micromonospora yangpuensis]SCL49360.1 23S rRNA m(1)G-748 methyltransferase [Micromonospora yangpuensis]